MSKLTRLFALTFVAVLLIFGVSCSDIEKVNGITSLKFLEGEKNVSAIDMIRTEDVSVTLEVLPADNTDELEVFVVENEEGLELSFDRTSGLLEIKALVEGDYKIKAVAGSRVTKTLKVSVTDASAKYATFKTDGAPVASLSALLGKQTVVDCVFETKDNLPAVDKITSVSAEGSNITVEKTGDTQFAVTGAAVGNDKVAIVTSTGRTFFLNVAVSCIHSTGFAVCKNGTPIDGDIAVLVGNTASFELVLLPENQTDIITSVTSNDTGKQYCSYSFEDGVLEIEAFKSGCVTFTVTTNNSDVYTFDIQNSVIPATSLVAVDENGQTITSLNVVKNKTASFFVKMNPFNTTDTALLSLASDTDSFELNSYSAKNGDEIIISAVSGTEEPVSILASTRSGSVASGTIIDITVEEIHATSLSVKNGQDAVSALSLAKGSTADLTVTVTPEDCTDEIEAVYDSENFTVTQNEDGTWTVEALNITSETEIFKFTAGEKEASVSIDVFNDCATVESVVPSVGKMGAIRENAVVTYTITVANKEEAEASGFITIDTDSYYCEGTSKKDAGTIVLASEETGADVNGSSITIPYSLDAASEGVGTTATYTFTADFKNVSKANLVKKYNFFVTAQTGAGDAVTVLNQGAGDAYDAGTIARFESLKTEAGLAAVYEDLGLGTLNEINAKSSGKNAIALYSWAVRGDSTLIKGVVPMKATEEPYHANDWTVGKLCKTATYKDFMLSASRAGGIVNNYLGGDKAITFTDIDDTTKLPLAESVDYDGFEIGDTIIFESANWNGASTIIYVGKDNADNMKFVYIKETATGTDADNHEPTRTNSMTSIIGKDDISQILPSVYAWFVFRPTKENAHMWTSVTTLEFEDDSIEVDSALNSSVQLAVTYGPDTAVSNLAVEWTSSDSDIITVDKDGLVEIADGAEEGTGTVTVTAKVCDVTATCTVSYNIFSAPALSVSQRSEEYGVLGTVRNAAALGSDTLVYDVTVSNSGSAPATDTVITATPAITVNGATATVSVTSVANGSIDNGSAKWTVTIPAGGSVDLSYTVKINSYSDITKYGNITSSVTATCANVVENDVFSLKTGGKNYPAESISRFESLADATTLQTVYTELGIGAVGSKLSYAASKAFTVLYSWAVRGDKTVIQNVVPQKGTLSGYHANKWGAGNICLNPKTSTYDIIVLAQASERPGFVNDIVGAGSKSTLNVHLYENDVTEDELELRKMVYDGMQIGDVIVYEKDAKAGSSNIIYVGKDSSQNMKFVHIQDLCNIDPSVTEGRKSSATTIIGKDEVESILDDMAFYILYRPTNKTPNIYTPVTGIELNETSYSLTNDTPSVQLEVSYLPSDTTESPEITWSCNPAEGVVSVEDGLVTAIGSGEDSATVTATCGTLTASCEISTDIKAAAALSWDQDSAEYGKIGTFRTAANGGSDVFTGNITITNTGSAAGTIDTMTATLTFTDPESGTFNHTIQNISNSGSEESNVITWTNIEVAASSSVTLSYEISIAGSTGLSGHAVIEASVTDGTNTVKNAWVGGGKALTAEMIARFGSLTSVADVETVMGTAYDVSTPDVNNFYMNIVAGTTGKTYMPYTIDVDCISTVIIPGYSTSHNKYKVVFNGNDNFIKGLGSSATSMTVMDSYWTKALGNTAAGNSVGQSIVYGAFVSNGLSGFTVNNNLTYKVSKEILADAVANDGLEVGDIIVTPSNKAGGNAAVAYADCFAVYLGKDKGFACFRGKTRSMQSSYAAFIEGLPGGNVNWYFIYRPTQGFEDLAGYVNTTFNSN